MQESQDWKERATCNVKRCGYHRRINSYKKKDTGGKMSSDYDVLLHKLQDKNDEDNKNLLYDFIDYFEKDDFNRLDMKIIADTFLKERSIEE